MDRSVFFTLALVTTSALGQTYNSGSQWPITDGKQCGFRLTISSTGFAGTEFSIPNVKQNAVLVFVKLENLNDFPVRYDPYATEIRWKVAIIKPETAWLPFPQEPPLTQEEKDYRSGKLRLWGRIWTIPANGERFNVRDLREVHELAPGKYKVTAYRVRPSPEGYSAKLHPTCSTPVWVQSNEIEIEVQK